MPHPINAPGLYHTCIWVRSCMHARVRIRVSVRVHVRVVRCTRARLVQAASGVGENAERQRDTIVREIRPQVRLVPHAQHLSVEFHGSLHVLHKDACMLQFAVPDRRGPGRLCGASAHGVPGDQGVAAWSVRRLTAEVSGCY